MSDSEDHGPVTPRPESPRLLNLEPRDDLKGAISNTRRNLPALFEHVQMQAKLRRVAYLAYLEEGFTEAQALELCKS
jgi:hypothetical protein